jgi:hypothetical protein
VHWNYKLIPVYFCAYVGTVTVQNVVAYRAARSDHLDTAVRDRITNKNFKYAARGEEEMKTDYKRFIVRDVRVCAG